MKAERSRASHSGLWFVLYLINVMFYVGISSLLERAFRKGSRQRGATLDVPR